LVTPLATTIRGVTVNDADPLHTLRRRTSEKWRTYPDDVLPMFVAETDFPLAPAIKSALHEAIELGDTGYVNPHDTGAFDALAKFATQRWAWSPQPERMGITTDVSVVIVESLRRVIKPGDSVIINPPIYPPFYDMVPEAGGQVKEVPLLTDGTGFALDLDGIDHALVDGARGILLCSPHNPVGLVHTREQLAELSRIVERRGGFVISDEIHAPLTHHDSTFVPYLSVSDEARAHGISALSASKAFNLAGLKCAFFVAECDSLTALINSLPEEVTFRTGLFGLIATREGFARGREWLDGTIRAIENNFALLGEQLAEKLPQVRMAKPDASYLAWLDMSGLGWGNDPAKIALETGKVALARGPSFGSPGVGHARMNLGCAPDTVVEAVDRLARAARP
jgi:cysteine-S-conjugate beta-lyase